MIYFYLEMINTKYPIAYLFLSSVFINPQGIYSLSFFFCDLFYFSLVKEVFVLDVKMYCSTRIHELFIKFVIIIYIKVYMVYNRIEHLYIILNE